MLLSYDRSHYRGITYAQVSRTASKPQNQQAAPVIGSSVQSRRNHARSSGQQIMLACCAADDGLANPQLLGSRSSAGRPSYTVTNTNAVART